MGLCTVSVFVSSKSHNHPVGLFVDVSVKSTLRLFAVTSTLKLATGGAVTLTVLLIALLPPALLTVSVTV